MTNPFKKKIEAFTFSAKGLGRTFKVTTADGKKYYTNRRDYIHIGYEWNRARQLTIEKITASSLLELGIKEGIKVSELDKSYLYVQPIKVEQVYAKEIDLIETWSDMYRPFWTSKTTFYTEDAIRIQQTV